ncbi:MAG: class I tRNA ligase family protein, partial [Bacteroidota bacterium]
PLTILISPYAPHIAEELWQLLGYDQTITYNAYPEWDGKYLVEDTFLYPVSFNGKLRFKLEFPLDMSKEDIEKAVLEAEEARKWLEGKPPKKVIVVPKRIINVVV